MWAPSRLWLNGPSDRALYVFAPVDVSCSALNSVPAPPEAGPRADAGPARAGAAAGNNPGNPGVPAATPAASPNAQNQDLLNRLSLLNWRDETQVLLPGAPPTPRPGWFHRSKAFISYFILTMHPAYWNRRRRALRARENLVRQTFPTTDAAAQKKVKSG